MNSLSQQQKAKEFAIFRLRLQGRHETLGAPVRDVTM
jgi:hypothetical protein